MNFMPSPLILEMVLAQSLFLLHLTIESRLSANNEATHS